MDKIKLQAKINLLYKAFDSLIELSTIGYIDRYRETMKKLQEDIHKAKQELNN